MSSISDFKAQMIAGGARSNQFAVGINFPTAVTNGSVAGQKLQFMAKAAQLPASTVSNMQVFYRGRPVNFAGEREFQPWTIEVYNDNDFVVRNALESWVNKIQNADSTLGLLNPSDYQADMQVHQLDRNDAIVKTYDFKDAYPMDVSAIGMSWESNNQIETYQVTFQYNYWVSPTSSV